MFRARFGLILLCFAAFALVSIPAARADWGAWGQVKTLADAGKWDEALKTLQASPSDTPAYYYDVGTALLRLNRSGPALAYLEKANRLEPHDPEIQANLTDARAELGRLIGADRLDPASSWSESIADHVSLDEVRGAVGLLGLVLALLWIRAYFRSRNLKQTLLQPGGILGILGLLITFGLYAAERFVEQRPPAVALERQVIRSGPGDHFLELAPLEAGVKLRLLGPSAADGGQSWVQVKFSQDGVGWVRAGALLVL